MTPPVRRFADSPVRRFAGYLPRRFAGVIICCIVIGRARSARCAAGQDRRLLHYKRAARFQLRHALLEVARTEWSTSASSWEQGRSTPAVVVDIEGLKDGRHQCFEVGPICVDLFSSTSTLESDTVTRRSPVRRFAGVPICCAERWSLIRRYADSPEYQSVVLNVGI